MPKLPVSLVAAVCACSLTAGEVFFDDAGSVGRIEFREGAAEVSGPVTDWSGYDRLADRGAGRFPAHGARTRLYDR